MKKAILIFISLILLSATGCSVKVIKHHYIFKGENECWTVAYEVNAKETFFKKSDTLHYESKSNNTFTATYKKDLSDLATNKNIEISYKSSVGGGELTEEIDKVNPQKTYSMKGSSTGGAIENEDEVIVVNINIDGNEQTIDLKNSLLTTAYENNDTEVAISLKFDVSDLTDADFSNVGTFELDNAQKEDFKKISFTLNVSNPDDITKRSIIFPEAGEIMKLASSNNINRYWYGSSYSNNSNVRYADYGNDFILYSKGLTTQAMKDMFGSLNVKVSWYSAEGVFNEKVLLVSDVINFD